MKPAELARLCPDLAGQAIRPLGQGFDVRAFLVGETVIRLAPAEALAREARLLAEVRPHISLAVPDLVFQPGPPPFTRHRLIPGSQLPPERYDRLSETARNRLAQDLARFHADCHRLTPEAGPVQPWPAPCLPEGARSPRTLALLAEWQALPPEPEVWGHFDAHGWNMAYDDGLRGIYDFGDSGYGPLHRDLVYSALVSPDLTLRLGRAYAALTLRPIDLNRLRILSGAHRLWEYDGSPFQTAMLRRWLDFDWQKT